MTTAAPDPSTSDALRLRRDIARLVASIHAQVSPSELERRAVAPTFLLQPDEWAAHTRNPWVGGRPTPTNATVRMPPELLQDVDTNEDPVHGLRGYVHICTAIGNPYERRYVEVVGNVLFIFESEPYTEEDRRTLARGCLDLSRVELVSHPDDSVCGLYEVELGTSDETWWIAFETAQQYRHLVEILCGIVPSTATYLLNPGLLRSGYTTTEASIKVEPSTTVGEAVALAFESFRKNSGPGRLLPHTPSEYVIKLAGFRDYMLDHSRQLCEHVHMNEHWRSVADGTTTSTSLRLTLMHKSHISNALALNEESTAYLFDGTYSDRSLRAVANDGITPTSEATTAETDDGTTTHENPKKRLFDQVSECVVDGFEPTIAMETKQQSTPKRQRPTSPSEHPISTIQTHPTAAVPTSNIPSVDPSQSPLPPDDVSVDTLRLDILAHPLSPLKTAQDALLWASRELFTDLPEALPRILRCIDWKNQDQVDEMLRLLPRWAPPSHPASWMELLRPEFTHDAVRKFAVDKIDEIPDATLSLFLPQLVQALKCERCISSPLALLLIKRAFLAPMQVGFELFWLLKVETYDAMHCDFFTAVLNAYLKGISPTTRYLFEIQDALFSEGGIFYHVWLSVSDHKKEGIDAMNRVLRNELSAVSGSLPALIQVPTSARREVRGCVVLDKCRVLLSPKFDLLLVFEAADSEQSGEVISVIFKYEQDLREERFTVQLIQLMDDMWRHDDLDVVATPIRCVAMSPRCGVVDVVEDAVSLAEARRGSSGTTPRNAESSLSQWLSANASISSSQATSILNLRRSCVGWITACAVLGIDDRDDENTVVTPAGHFFYVGLTNRSSIQETERPQFAFTEELASAMRNVTVFPVRECVEAFNSIRRRMHLVVSMMQLMAWSVSSSNTVQSFVSALKPELNEEETRDNVTRAIYACIGLPSEGDLKCRYRVGRICMHERALKKNGKLHLLCEMHRQRANHQQRIWIARPSKRGTKERVLVDSEIGGIFRPEATATVEDAGGFLANAHAYGVWNGAALGAYRVESSDIQVHKQLSRGRYGELWVGSLHTQYVAVKRLAVGDQAKANAIALGSEVELMTTLQHPRLVSFIGVEWAREWEAQVVTEFMAHGDVRTFLDAEQQKHEMERLRWGDLKCQVAIDVADALAYLHDRARRVCMQTLKARNVLLEADPVSVDGCTSLAKLSLYAVARSRPVLSASNADELSLRWLAPELAISGSSWTDRATIYSFGVFLSELDTSMVPYHNVVNPNGSAMSSFKILQLVSKGELRPSLTQDCPTAIAAVIRQCLAHDPSQRPSAAQLAVQLRHIRKSEL